MRKPGDDADRDATCGRRSKSGRWQNAAATVASRRRVGQRRHASRRGACRRRCSRRCRRRRCSGCVEEGATLVGQRRAAELRMNGQRRLQRVVKVDGGCELIDGGIG